jgi:predicted nucleic acid-binding Zn ribbon protein
MSPWRPLPGGPDDRDPRPVADSLGRLAQRLGAPSPQVLTTVFAQWDEIVGPTVAAHAWPLALSDGVLRIGVDQPGWATELRFLGAELLQKLAAAVGEATIQRVDVKVVGARRQ